MIGSRASVPKEIVAPHIVSGQPRATKCSGTAANSHESLISFRYGTRKSRTKAWPRSGGGGSGGSSGSK